MEQIITRITCFSFLNPHGGTGISNGSYDKRFNESSSEVIVYRAFHDYEVGWRFYGVSNDKKLSAYLDEVAKDDNQFVYFSEHELVAPDEAQVLVERLAATLATVETEDGFVFHKQPDGTWSGGGMSYPSIKELMTEVSITLDCGFSESEIKIKKKFS